MLFLYSISLFYSVIFFRFIIELSSAFVFLMRSYDQNIVNENIVMQGHHFSLLQHETEKLRNDIEKMRSELRSGLYGSIDCP